MGMTLRYKREIERGGLALFGSAILTPPPFFNLTLWPLCVFFLVTSNAYGFIPPVAAHGTDLISYFFNLFPSFSDLYFMCKYTQSKPLVFMFSPPLTHVFPAMIKTWAVADLHSDSFCFLPVTAYVFNLSINKPAADSSLFISNKEMDYMAV